MSAIFRKKTFPLCSFSISKCLPTTTSQSPPRLSDTENDDQFMSHSTSYSSSSILTKNFNSLYTDLAAASSAGSTSKSAATDDFFSSADDYDVDSDHSPALDFAAVFASQRFFFSSPGKSNSITDSKPAAAAGKSPPPFDGVEVRKYSVDPYLDFRRSMQEMIEARDVVGDDDNRSDLEYLHELLLYFLSLNPRDTHRFIIRAFSDIVVDTLSSAPDRACRHREVKLRRRHNRLRRLSM